jgi:hypothetical protein
MSALQEEIVALLRDRPADLDQVERTLTDGYAAALSIEAETRRLERRLAEAAGAMEGGDTDSKARELSSLARRLTGRKGDLASLRALLTELRRHADALRPGTKPAA